MRIIDTLRVPIMRINIHGDALSLIMYQISMALSYQIKLIRVRWS